VTTIEDTVPTDVGTAFQLWWGIAGFGIVNLMATIVTAIGQRGTYAQQLLDDMRARDPKVALKLSDVELLVTAGFLGSAFVGLAVAGLVLLVAHKMRKGRFWARTLLTAIGAILVIVAVPTLFGLGDAHGPMAVVMGGAAIVQAVLAGGAIVLTHRPDANDYFVRKRV
jgi:hypothetical protein